MNEYKVRKTIKRLKATQKVQKAEIAIQKSKIKELLDIPVDMRDNYDEHILEEAELSCEIYKTNVGYMNNAIGALRKQLPMRPKEKHCPCCEGFLFNWYDYCPYCGQRLEWEEEC